MNIKKLKDEEKITAGTCRYCGAGLGAYEVRNSKGEIFFVCEKHYRELVDGKRDVDE